MNNLSTSLISKDGMHFSVHSGKHYDFWKRFQNGEWEPETLRILRRYLDKKHSYVDVGAWIGPTVLYACQLTKHCYALEPDPIAFQELKSNVNLNKRLISQITLCDLAISNSSCPVRLYQGKLPGQQSEWGNSMSSLLTDGKKVSTEVRASTFQQFADDYAISDCGFIKMDIEGGEVTVSPNMYDYLKANRPTLLLELHPMYITDSADLLREVRVIQTVLSLYDRVYNERDESIDLDSVVSSLIDEKGKTTRIVLMSQR